MIKDAFLGDTSSVQCNQCLLALSLAIVPLILHQHVLF
jgi:hypothetical protein